MSSYNGVERAIAKFLSKFPFLKALLKKSYSRIVFYNNKKSYKFKSRNKLSSYCDNRGGESFFGYYDKSPENENGLVMGHSSYQSTSKAPSDLNSLDIVVFTKSGKAIYQVNTKAFNWQQGARAHWVTGDTFIFNDFDELEQKYFSKVVSLKDNSEASRFTHPVQDSYRDVYFLSINYRRLMALRPDYGYRNLPSLCKAELDDLTSDGIWKIDYKTGKADLLITIEQACNLHEVPSLGKATHKFNHVMISPSGKRFVFMHRYLINGKRFDRLLLADSDGEGLSLLNDYGMVSHCSWIDDNTILGFMRGPGDIDGYWLVDVNTKVFLPCLQEKLSKYGDGHPHVQGEWFVTDTYPDKARMQHLLLCNWKTGEVKELGEFFHGFEFGGESRCDLHPRFSPNGRSVYFDSVFSGQRQLYRMELSN